MNAHADPRRALIAEGAIGIALCLGLHFLLIGPLQTKLDDRRAEVSRLMASHADAAMLVSRMPDVMKALHRQTLEATGINERGSVVRDEGAMFTTMMSLAADAGIRIHLMEPLKDNPLAPQAGASPSAPPTRPGDRALSYSISATGAYPDMCRFLHALQNELAFTLVGSVRLTPGVASAAGGEPMVSAVIETAHFSLDVSIPVDLAAAAATGGAP